MSKRPHNLEEDLERLYKKMRKLEKKIKARDESRSVPPDQPPDLPTDLPPEEDTNDMMENAGYYEEFSQQCESQVIEDLISPGSQIDQDVIITENPNSASDEVHNNISLPECTASTSAEDTPAPEIVDDSLDDDILEILGDDPSSSIKYGPEIHNELASRFQHIATEGLSKDTRKELIKKYLLPANCLRVGAPAINLEIKAALNENTLKRDKGIESKQTEMSSAISCLMDIISSLLSSKEKNNVVLQKLMDVGRILCDIQHGDSITRRNFILFAVKNDMQEHLKNTKIDTFLFSEKLSDTLKTAKAVNKSGAELKYDNSKNFPKKYKTSVVQPLNRKMAPPARRPPVAAPVAALRGRDRESVHPQRARVPPLPQHTASYKTSLTRPPLPQSRRRY